MITQPHNNSTTAFFQKASTPVTSTPARQKSSASDWPCYRPPPWRIATVIIKLKVAVESNTNRSMICSESLPKSTVLCSFRPSLAWWRKHPRTVKNQVKFTKCFSLMRTKYWSLNPSAFPPKCPMSTMDPISREAMWAETTQPLTTPTTVNSRGRPQPTPGSLTASQDPTRQDTPMWVKGIEN